jgi:hypothetical protein
MFDSITWTNYITGVLLITATYYILVGIRFYSLDLKHFFSSGFKKRPTVISEYSPAVAPAVQAAAVQMELSFAHTSDDTFRQVEGLIEKLKKAIEEAARNASFKEEFIYSLTLILKDYTDLKGTPFQSAIHELIMAECEKLGFLTLDEKEMHRLWG